MAYETILVEQRDAVTLITINRPQALNALNTQVLKDLSVAFADLLDKSFVLLNTTAHHIPIRDFVA